MINDITIGPLTIHVYGIMVAIGYMSALLISERRARKRGLDSDILFGIFWCAVLGGAVGSKLLYYTVSFKDILNDPSMLLNFQNGWVVYGGIIGGVAAGWGYCRFKKADFLTYLDLVLPAVAFAQGCGRIGCFFAGCCYGRETESIFGIQYWQSYAKKQPQKGRVAAGYCILYSIGRFLIEMLRNDYRGEFGFLSTSQLISILILAVGIGLFVWAGTKTEENKETWTGI